MALRILPNADPRDVTAIDLENVLSRLEHKILSPNADPALLHSSYQRIKTSHNLEYARTLLLRLEQHSAGIKIQSRKTAAQTSLSAQRALIKRLTDRLHDLERIGDDDEDDDTLAGAGPGVDEEEGEEEEEDILAEYDDPVSKPPNLNTHTTGNSNTSTQPPAPPSSTLSDPPPPPSSQSEPTSVLRNRLFNTTTSPTSPTQAHTTSSSSTTSAQAPKSTTAILESRESTNIDLTASLVDLAQRLKASTNDFSTSLAADTATLDRAADGLDRNTAGLDAAGKRMGMLRRMSEGRGWFGRMMLYAWIAGLWVVAVLLVGVGPKLRF